MEDKSGDDYSDYYSVRTTAEPKATHRPSVSCPLRAPCAPLAPVRAHTPLTCNPLPSKHTHSPLPVYTCHPFFVVRAPLHSLVTALLLRCARSMVTRTSQAHSVDDVGCMEEMGGGGLPASSRAACVCGW